MTQVLTWKYLSPEHVHKCLAAEGPEALYQAISDADASNAGSFKLLRTMYLATPNKASEATADGTPASNHSVLYIQPFEVSQRQVMLDLFFHLLLKCREAQMTPEKTSAIVGLVARTHAESMERVLSLQQSYTVFGQLLQLHAVHRPPFSSAVLTIDDAKVITDYFLGTYYRQYKLYLYVFTPRRVATVKGFVLGEGTHDVPPILPAQGGAISLQRYEAAKSEVANAEQAKIDAEARDRKNREDAERQKELEEQARIPPIPSGLQQQLTAIRSNVVGLSVNKLDALEAKLERIEARIAESQQSAAQQPQTNKRGGTISGSPKRR
eukprot:GILI01017178.1.p1 GENE.GILI01017178.1~~GILI01017178.1.p1  ORF type:complete len:324 (-),score=80.62 GILI01017178.1:59-1030(-)